MSVKTVRTGKLGKRELRLVSKDGRFYGLVDGRISSQDKDADAAWKQLHDEAGKSDPRYFGYAGARSRFLRFFPGGFSADRYAGKERDFKLRAKALLDDLAPLDRAARDTGLGEAVLSVFRATTMLAPFEKMKVQGLLRGDDADAFVEAAARFTQECDKPALDNLARILKPHDAAKWTIATYLPYLWTPERHMFLKPEVTKDYAARVGHPFSELYGAPLSFDVYAALLDMVDRTEQELSDLEPRDRIDIQSFIWVIGAYQDEDVPEADAALS